MTIRSAIDVRGPARRASARLPLTPLIDVVFILLVFFMLETDFLKPRAVELAQGGSEAAGVSESKPIYVELHADGTIWLNGAERGFDELSNAMRELAPGRETQVIVASDPGVILQRVVDIIDVLNSLGLMKVSLREASQFD